MSLGLHYGYPLCRTCSDFKDRRAYKVKYNPDRAFSLPEIGKDNDKSLLGDTIKRNRHFINQALKVAATGAALPLLGPALPLVAPALFRAASVEADGETDWEKMTADTRSVLTDAIIGYVVGAIIEYAVGYAVEAIQEAMEPDSRSNRSLDHSANRAHEVSALFKTNLRSLPMIARSTALHDCLRWINAGGLQAENDQLTTDDGEEMKGFKIKIPSRWRPPHFSPLIIAAGEGLVTAMGAPGVATLILEGSNVLAAKDLVRGNEDREGSNDMADGDRSWLSQAIRHNKKIIDQLAQIAVNAVVGTMLEQGAKDGSIEMMAKTGASPADVLCWSGCLDNQKVCVISKQSCV